MWLISSFTRAVLDEALRLYPPIPLLPREVTREEHVRSRVVAPGDIVLAVPWLLHRHRKLWDRPDHFMPERFLPGAAPDRPAMPIFRLEPDLEPAPGQPSPSPSRSSPSPPSPRACGCVRCRGGWSSRSGASSSSPATRSS